MPLVLRCPSKSTWMSFPLCNKCPPRTLDHISTRPRALKPSNEYIALEKHANGQRRSSPRGLTTMSLARRCPSKGTRMRPPPHATSVFPMHSALSQLIEEPSNPKASMLPRKKVSMANVMAHPKGSPMPPTRCCPLKGTWMSLPPCNECHSCVLSPILARQ